MSGTTLISRTQSKKRVDAKVCFRSTPLPRREQWCNRDVQNGWRVLCITRHAQPLDGDPRPGTIGDVQLVGHPRSPAALSAVTRDQIPTDAERRAGLSQSTQCPSYGSSILLDGYFHRRVPQALPESPKETSQGKQTDGYEISW
jgi:hypothetical protein